jgi:hypothetical protein
MTARSRPCSAPSAARYSTFEVRSAYALCRLGQRRMVYIEHIRAEHHPEQRAVLRSRTARNPARLPRALRAVFGIAGSNLVRNRRRKALESAYRKGCEQARLVAEEVRRGGV